VRAIALYVIALWGWRRALAALAAGALLSLSMPPFDLWPVLVISFPVLVWLLDGVGDVATRPFARAWQSFIIGWVFGFGYFLAGLYWVGHAFLVDAGTYGWLMPAVVTVLPAGLALFIGVGTALAQAFWSPGAMRICALAAAWVGLEWLRGHVLTGFPWNSIGYALTSGEALPQAASVIGAYGLGLIAVLIGALPALAASNTDLPGRNSLCPLAGPLAAVLLVISLWTFGVVRLAGAEGASVDGVRLRVVQPNIAQAEKWKRENRNKIFARIIGLSNTATSPQNMGIADVTHLVWPESAVPFLLADSESALAALAALLPDTATLLTGSLRAAPTPAGEQQAPGRRAIRNSVLQIDGTGKVVDAYDKFHLVPFGEYTPAAAFFSRFGIRQVVKIPVGFEDGAGPTTMAVANAPAVAPLICYEIIFPGAAVDRNKRPGWILNVTNDAWFGDSTGPHQHLRQARVRAIEEGLPVVRSANTGISAVIDAHGRFVRKLPLGVAGVIDTGLPKALAPTPYARFGDWLMVPFLVLIGLIGLVGRLRLSGAGNGPGPGSRKA